MTVVYRLLRGERAREALSGEGARVYGGRWNPPGTAVVYASASRALAILEMFVNLTLEARSMRFVLCTIELPPRVRLTRHANEWPPRAFSASQEIGRRWLHGGRTLALVVPSVIVPHEVNYILNVGHALFGRLAVRQEHFSFDGRLWRSNDGDR